MNIVRRELTGLLVKEEQMWKQWLRALWLQEGDKNTRFFHSRATHRYCRNKIVEIKNSKGVVCSDEESISNTFINYYQELFMSFQPSNLDAAVVDIPRTITEEVNAWLEAKYIREEVEWALKQMEPLKAPGPNGLSSLFFQKYWQDVGDDVSQAVLHYLNIVSFPSSLNHTFIILIPKVKSSIRVFEYRPISLCNILYKLVSKVVANRLKQVLSNLISES